MPVVRSQNTVDSTVTIIGGSVQVRGNLSGDEDLHVLGRVDGSIELQRTLVVAESGIVKAEVRVKNAIVSGVVVGNIHASESVEITREGCMVGDISAPRVIIVDGASFRGNVDMGDIENMPVRKPSADRPAPERPRSSPSAPPPRVTPSRPSYASSAQPSANASVTNRPAPSPARAPSIPPTPASSPSPSLASTQVLEVDDDDEEAGDLDDTATDAGPSAKGLPRRSQKTRVIVKRK